MASSVSGQFIFAILIPIMLLVGCSPLSIVPEKHYEVARANKPYDAIIVPGFPYHEGALPTIMKIRLLWSEYLYAQGMTRNVIYSGGAVYSPYMESKIMALYGEAMGIPKRHIFIEEKAEYSTENLYFGYQMAKELGFDKIALATDPFQTAKLVSYMDKLNVHMDIIPIIYDTLISLPEPNVQVDPSSALVKDFVPVNERDGLYKRWRGSRGKLVHRFE